MIMSEEIARTTACLQKGGTILYPTDTIWGLGCDATNRKAVRALKKIKKRADRKSFIVLVENEDMLREYVSDIPDVAWELLKSIDTPLTIVYPKAKNLAKSVISEDGSIGIRIPKDLFVQELLKAFGKPLVSTSANFSGDPSPTTFRDIHPDLLDAVDYAVEYNRSRLEVMKPSTIIRLSGEGDYEVLRK